MKNILTSAIWDYHVNRGVLVIRDQSTDSCTVTNDAENVLESLRDEIGAEAFDSAPAVIYRDSEGNYDGMVLDPDRRQVSFYSLASTDEEAAVSRALETKRGTLLSY